MPLPWWISLYAVKFSWLIHLGHIWPCISIVVTNFSLHESGFLDNWFPIICPPFLKVCFGALVREGWSAIFSSYNIRAFMISSLRVGFSNSRVSDTFCPMLPLWQISSHAGQVFLTHALWEHFNLCFCHSRFFMQVGFFWFMCIEYVLLYASVVTYCFTWVDF